MNIPPAIIQAIGWALIHSLWQGALIGLGAAAFLKLSGARNSEARYVINCLALAVLIAWSGWTFASGMKANRLAPAGEETVFAAAIPSSDAFSSERGMVSGRVFHFDLERGMPVIVGVWIFGVAAMAFRMILASCWISRLRRSASVWNEESWQEKFRKWSSAVGVSRAVQLCTTTMSEVPAVIGHFKPIVLLPAAILTRLTPSQLEAVILHELMHIARNDYLVNVVQTFCETIFFFNPPVWWLSRLIRIERENSCDDLVAGRNGDKVEYAKALVRLEGLRSAPEGALVLASTGGALRKRIARLLAREQRTGAFSASSGMVVLGFVVVAMLAFTWPNAVAQQKQAVPFELRRVAEQGAPDSELVPFAESKGGRPLSVSKAAILDSSHVAEAKLAEDPVSQRPIIKVRLTKKGAEIFSKATKESVGHRLAIVVGGKILSAPVVREQISVGELEISGNFSREEAAELAKKLQPAGKGPSKDTGAWSPPEGTLPSAVFRMAQQDRAAGRYEEALQKHLWYHRASREEPGQGGVRLSFALSDWLQLGQAYPPALAKLKEVRDQTAEALRKMDRAEDPFTLFHEYASINHTLNNDPKTAELFIWLDANDPEIARKAYGVAEPALIKAKEFKLCGKYVKAEDIDQIIANRRLNEKIATENPKTHIRPFAEKKFRNSAATLVSLLVKNDKEAQARQAAEKALAAWNDPELKTSIEAALRGQLAGTVALRRLEAADGGFAN